MKKLNEARESFGTSDGKILYKDGSGNIKVYYIVNTI